MKFWFYVIVGIIGAVWIAVQWTEDRIRARRMQSLAKKLGFAYLGKRTLPEALSLYGTPFNHRNSTSNLIDGELSGIRMIVFDCELGESKTTWQRTVIAVRTSSDTLAASALGAKLTIEKSASWKILYYPWGSRPSSLGLTPVSELEVQIEVLKH